VSTREQDLALQLDVLKAADCERVFEEKTSGAKRERLKRCSPARRQLARCQASLRAANKTLLGDEQGQSREVWERRAHPKRSRCYTAMRTASNPSLRGHRLGRTVTNCWISCLRRQRGKTGRSGQRLLQRGRSYRSHDICLKPVPAPPGAPR